MKNFTNSTNSKLTHRHSDKSQNPLKSKYELKKSISKQNTVPKLPLLPRTELTRKAEQQRGQGGFHHRTQVEITSKYELQNSTLEQNTVLKLPLLPRTELTRKAEQQRGQGGFHHQNPTKSTSKFSYFLLLILFLSINSTLQAQIIGRVLDAQTKKPLQGASIQILNSQIGTQTDESGFFEIKTISKNEEILISFVGYASKKQALSSTKTNLGDIYLFSESILSEDIIVNAQRVDASTPMAFKTLTSEDIERINLGQDLPYLIQMTPSILSSSDAGAGVGYTYMSIRGVDQARINVTINGIPVNDAESHGVWWVNMPDFSSSVESIQIQRGVGTSTNGSAAFGASINMATNSLSAEPFATISTSYGSFNSQKISTEFGTGLLKNGWAFDGRLSKIQSDGYIDRASSDLSSYFLNATWNGKNQLLKVNVFSGTEKTYQAWYGTPEALVFGNQDDLQSYIDRNGWGLSSTDITNLQTAGRRYNFYTYDNETDNYTQHHYQVHYSRKVSDVLNANFSLHYTKGSGFYETFVTQGNMENYQLNPVTVNGNLITETDLIRRLWLDNDFYGVTFGTEWTPRSGMKILSGGAVNNYIGDHFGEVVWAEYMQGTPIRNRFYDNTGRKSDVTLYTKWIQEFGDFTAYADLQLRNIVYRFEGFTRVTGDVIAPTDLRDSLTFVNPKVGVTWNPTKNQRAFASFSVGNKEATRNEYTNSLFSNRPQHETLHDWEAGYQIGLENWQFELVAYFMDYKNQLLETGAINDVGEYIRQNVANSYRSGIELMLQGKLMESLTLNTALTLSRNRAERVNQYMDNYDLDYVNDLPQQDVSTFSNTPLSQSPELIWNTSLSWTKDQFSAEWFGRYVGKQFLDNTGSDAKSIPAYFVNDLRLGFDWEFTSKSQVQLSVLVNNVFNELYAPRGYTYSYISGGETITENFYYPQATRNVLAQVKFSF